MGYFLDKHLFLLPTIVVVTNIKVDITEVVALAKTEKAMACGPAKITPFRSQASGLNLY